MENNRLNIKRATAFLCDKIKYTLNLIEESECENIREIRLKRNAPIIITSNKNLFLKYNGQLTDVLNLNEVCFFDSYDMDESVKKLCNYSIHAFQNEMKNGFITVDGGHRVGIAATAVTDPKGNITAIKDVSSLNIRIARQIKGCANDIIKNVLHNGLKSILIIGEPTSGKTTVLRDLSTRIGGFEFGFKRVCIIDERSEIDPIETLDRKNNIGTSCDVLRGYPKGEGMLIALRALSPDVIVCDEIGSENDVFAIEKISNCGVKLIATIHANNISELLKRPQFESLMRTGAFDVGVILSGKNNPGKISEILSLKKYWR